MWQSIRAVCPAVLMMLLLSGAFAPALSGQYLPPPPPQPPHPDSGRVVAIAQAASLFIASALLEETLRAGMAAEGPHAHHDLSRLGNLLGRGPTIAMAVGGVYGASRLAGLEEVSTPAGRTLAALVVAGVANGALKFGVGRARPRTAGDRAAFRPLAKEDSWQSFPSGHTLTAFALATAIAEQADRGWVTYPAYGTATLVGWSRIHEDRHWASDVVAGALIGTIMARMTVRRLEAREARGAGTRAHDPGGPAQSQLVIYPLPGGIGVSVGPR